ncbi:hypothetical protein LJR290_007487 [Variovorax sp. LjRoot290]|uniref:hypothetical protein n=1 Tax=Variovorax sp. LjRoot290 TaxID=3342316 RepID=UPI003ECD79FB
MLALLPLPPAIAYGLPWRMTFRTNRPPATLEKFADKSFVEGLTQDELKHSEAAISTLLAKMLATRKIPRTLSRWHLNLAASQKVWDERSPAGLKVSLGNTRFTVLEASDWIGDSVNRLVKSLRPDPGARLPEFKAQFAESDWEDIGHHGAAPAAVGGPKPRKAPARKPPPELDLTPPAGLAQRRRRQISNLKLLTRSGRPISGTDYRLGWLLFEIHKVVPLNHREPGHADDVLRKLEASSVPDASRLAKILRGRLETLESAQVPEEVREVLSTMLASTANSEPWTEQSLFWAFGVAPVRESFDAAFWAGTSETQARAFRLRRKLLPMTDPFITSSLHSPALELLAHELASTEFTGARRLQSRLGPLLGGAHVIGVSKFLTDVLGWKGGRLITITVAAGNGPEAAKSSLFFWTKAPHGVFPVHLLEVCVRARELTLARGAFDVSEVAAKFADHPSWNVSEETCVEILSEWPAVRWLDQRGIGVVDGASVLPALVEQLLNVTWPRPLNVNDVVEAIRSAPHAMSEMNAAQAKLDSEGLVPTTVLIEALDGAGNICRSGRNHLALKTAPAQDYFNLRPVELDLVAFLHTVGGSAPNREIYKHFHGDKGVEAGVLGAAMKALPYLYSPTPYTTAIRPWVIPRKTS